MGTVPALHSVKQVALFDRLCLKAASAFGGGKNGENSTQIMTGLPGAIQ